MGDILPHLVDQPITNLIVLGGLAFLFVAAVGKISGTIEPDTRGRVACGVVGLVLLGTGVRLHMNQDQVPDNACAAGYVWRLAVPGDHVCVTPETAAKVVTDNRLAPARVKNSGRYGADTCQDTFVWREAVPADHVCVTPDTRRQTADDTVQAASRAAGH
jgi:hypothetical protein